LLTAETACCNPFAAHASAPQALTAGTPYYLEALYKEGTGGDFCQVAAKLDTDPTPPNTLAPIGPQSLASLADTVNSTLTITRQPTDFLFIQNPRGPSGSNAVFSVTATGSGVLAYQWERDSGAGFQAIAGANGASYSFAPSLANDGAKYRVQVFTPGKTTTSAAGTLTVVQPNTPPSFVCGPAQSANEDSGAHTVGGWATGIQVHNIVRASISFSNDFNAATLPAGVTLTGSARLDSGAVQLTQLVGSQNGALDLNIGSTILFESIAGSWKSLVGGSGDGADGYSFNVASDIPIPVGGVGEEGVGSGLRLTVDTFDNGGGEDGIDIKWQATQVAFQHIPKNDDGSGVYLRKNAFVDASFSVTPLGVATFTYDGQTITATLPNYNGISANHVVFGARTGGAFDYHTVDDLGLIGFQKDSSSAENAQTVQFLVSNDNPGLFSAQPAVAPNGTLTYTSAPDACGVANVTVVAKDNGGTAYGGQDTSEPCGFTITLNGVNDAPSAVAQTVTARNCGATTIALGAVDPDAGGCGALPTGAALVSPTLHGTVVVAGLSATYTPNAGYLGPDSFSYTVTDGIATSAPATVTINVTTCNQAPIAKITTDGLVDFGTPNKLLIASGDEGCLVLDGSQSSDPDGDPLTYAWFDVPSVTPFGTGPVVTNCFDLGEHTVLLEVTDLPGAKGSDHITFDVVSAAEAIDILIDDINNSTIERKNKRPFIASLKAASASSERGNNTSAANQLHAFQNKVRAQVAKDNPTEAARWIAWAQDIIDALNGE
jgi:hypothetical protein